MSEESPSLVGVALRDLDRLRTVATIVARHGFGPMLAKTPLSRRLFKGAIPEGDRGMEKLSAPERFTKLLGALGPTFIKLGQILSMRRDVFAPEWIEALESLQDRAPVLSFEEVRSQVEKALGGRIEDLFAHFEDTPLATASIAQTHLARTHEGDRVVVKVQRPGIEKIMRGDLDLLFLGAQILEASIDELRLADVTGIVTEFERGLLRELNFQQELSNLVEMRKNLDPERRVTVPQPFPDLSARIVLTMQFFPGKPLRRVVAASEEAKLACEEVVHSACKQVFIDGLFHGDPHAGNLLINEQGTLCMIDLGMVGRLSQDQRDDLVTLIMAAVTGDSGTIARVLLKMGTPTQRVNILEMRAEIERIRTEFLLVGSLDEVDTSGFIEKFAAAAGKFRIKLASEYVILTKAAATIEGIIRNLDGKVDLVGIAMPYVKEIMARRFAPETLLRDALGDAGSLGHTLRSLPAQLDQVLHDFQTGNIQVRALTTELDELPSLVHQHASRTVLAMFAGSLALACALLVPSGLTHWIPATLAVFCGVSSTISWLVLFSWHFLGRGKPMRVTPFLRFLRR